MIILMELLNIFLLEKARNYDGPAPFEFKSDDNCGYNCVKWLRGFEIYTQANEIEQPKDKKNWMLHYAGPKVQDIFYTLPEIEEEEERQCGPYFSGYVFPRNEYNEALKKLNQFFEPKQNVSYERHVFHQLKQKKDERFDMYICGCASKLSGVIFETNWMIISATKLPVVVGRKCCAARFWKNTKRIWTKLFKWLRSLKLFRNSRKHLAKTYLKVIQCPQMHLMNVFAKLKPNGILVLVPGLIAISMVYVANVAWKDTSRQMKSAQPEARRVTRVVLIMCNFL